MSGPVVIVAGALANKAGNGGEAWVRLTWVRGLMDLGCDVHFVEELHPTGSTRRDAIARHWFTTVTEAAGIADRSTLLEPRGFAESTAARAKLRELATGADLLVNISGHLDDGTLRRAPRVRAFVDLDPGYTQIWAAQGLAGARVHGHDLHFTVGTRIGTEGCSVPTAGLRWRPVLPPVRLADWSPAGPADPDRLTTVGSWRGAYGPPEHDGRRYGLKCHEFRKLAPLPALVPQRCEAALAIEPEDAGDAERLAEGGWRLADPAHVAATPEAFRDYVRRSGAEVSAAQGVYVETRSGWCSDRSAAYLACGRPTLVQDTGCTALPVGDGIVTFQGLDDAARAARELARRYEHHAAAARELAASCLDARVVLSRFLDECGVAA